MKIYISAYNIMDDKECESEITVDDLRNMLECCSPEGTSVVMELEDVDIDGNLHFARRSYGIYE